MHNEIVNIRYKEIKEKLKIHWSLNNWVVGLYHIYCNVDRTISPSDMWLQVVNDASQLVEEIRKGRLIRSKEKRPDALRQLIKMFCWICGFIGKYTLDDTWGIQDPIKSLLKQNSCPDLNNIEESFEKWILSKYPRVCPVCGHEYCVCSSYKAITEFRDQNVEHYGLTYSQLQARWSEQKGDSKRKLKEDINNIIGQWPLDRWLQMFNRIYGMSHFGMTIESIAFHLLEEVGEVSNEILYIRQLRQMKKHKISHIIKGAIKNIDDPDDILEKIFANNQALESLTNSNILSLKNELADVFSWISALLYKIYSQANGGYLPNVKIQFSKELEGYFTTSQDAFGCHFCGHPKCSVNCVMINTATKIMRKASKK